MVLGVLHLEIHIPAAQSLKEKRRVLKSLTDRLRKRFNVAVAELDGMDLWQASVLAVATVARDSERVNQILSYAAQFVHAERSLSVTQESMELF